MLFNHLKIPVWKWDGKVESLCPECKAPLVARRGDLVIWHWAHHPVRNGAPRECGVEPESGWHLQMKMAYAGFDGWLSEEPVVIGGVRYALDAVSDRGGRVREFVHSINLARLARKCEALKKMDGYEVMWVYDGTEFASLRRRWGNKGEVRGLLKPLALDAHRMTGGLVHMHGVGARETGLWRHWKDNIWFPCEGEASKAVLAAYQGAKTKWDQIYSVLSHLEYKKEEGMK